MRSHCIAEYPGLLTVCCVPAEKAASSLRWGNYLMVSLVTLNIGLMGVDSDEGGTSKKASKLMKLWAMWRVWKS